MFTFERNKNLAIEPLLREYKRKDNIQAVRIDGPFRIINDYGETVQYCTNGYLVYRKGLNTFGLLSKEVFEEVYEKVK